MKHISSSFHTVGQRSRPWEGLSNSALCARLFEDSPAFTWPCRASQDSPSPPLTVPQNPSQTQAYCHHSSLTRWKLEARLVFWVFFPKAMPSLKWQLLSLKYCRSGNPLIFLVTFSGKQTPPRPLKARRVIALLCFFQVPLSYCNVSNSWRCPQGGEGEAGVQGRLRGGKGGGEELRDGGEKPVTKPGIQPVAWGAKHCILTGQRVWGGRPPKDGWPSGHREGMLVSLTGGASDRSSNRWTWAL